MFLVTATALQKATQKSDAERISTTTKSDRYDVKSYTRIFGEARSKFHPQHEVMCELATWCAPIMCRAPSRETRDFPLEQIEMKRHLAANYLRALDRAWPGLHKTRGKCIYEQLEVSLCLAEEDFRRKRIAAREYGERCRAVLELAREARKCFIEGIPRSPFEEVVVLRVEQLISQLETIT